MDSSAACTAIDSFRQPWSRANRFSPLSAEIEDGPSQGVLPVRRRLTLVGGRLLAAADTRQIEQHDLTRHDSDTESVDAGSGHNDVDARSAGLSGPGVLVRRTSRSMFCHSHCQSRCHEEEVSLLVWPVWMKCICLPFSSTGHM